MYVKWQVSPRNTRGITRFTIINTKVKNDTNKTLMLYGKAYTI